MEEKKHVVINNRTKEVLYESDDVGECFAFIQGFNLGYGDLAVLKELTEEQKCIHTKEN